MKRSSTIALTVVSTSFLTACGERVETFSYPSINACIAAKIFPVDKCKASFDEAQKMNSAVAPKFARKADCEDEFGRNQCSQTPAAQSGGHASFMPFMRGYLMGTNAGVHRVAAQPLYRSRTGGYFTSNGTAYAKELVTPARVSPSSVSQPAPRTTTIARGGFGHSYRSFSG